MPQSFQTIAHRDLSLGMDTRSALNNIKQGYAEVLRNLDTRSTGSVSKRKGYQGYKGWLPLRATDLEVELVGSEYKGTFTFDDNINLINSFGDPVVGYGKLWRKTTKLVAEDPLVFADVVVVGTAVTFDPDSTSVPQVNMMLRETGTSEERRLEFYDADTKTGVLAAPFTADWTAVGEYIYPAEFYWETYINKTVRQIPALTASTIEDSINPAGTARTLIGAVDVIDPPTDYSSVSITPVEASVTDDTITMEFNTLGNPDITNAVLYVLDPEVSNPDSYITGWTFVPHADASSSITGVSGDLLTLDNDLFEDGDIIELSGTLPTPLVAATQYYAIKGGINEIKVAASHDDAIAGTAITLTSSTTGGTVTDKRGHVHNIPATEHGLPNFFLVSQIFRDDTGLGIQFDLDLNPHQVIVQANGDIQVEFLGIESTIIFQMSIYDVSINNHQEVSLAAGTHIINFTDVDSLFNFAVGYLKVGTENQQIIPDSISYDVSTKTLSVEVTTNQSGILSVNYVEGQAISNQIIVDVNETYVNTPTPEFVFYGMYQGDITYSSSAPRGGEVNVLDEYTSVGVSDLVAGMGGNLYRETQTSGNPLTLPSYFVELQERLDDIAQTVGPYFGASDLMIAPDPPVPSSLPRGFRSSTTVNGMIPIISIVNNQPADETATLVLDEGTGVAGTLNNLDLDFDRVVITGASSGYNGSFEIESVNDDGGTTPYSITVRIPGLPKLLADDNNSRSRAAIYTNKLLMASTDLPYLVGDSINSTIFSSAPTVTAVGPLDALLDDDQIWVDGVLSEVTLPGTAIIASDRTSDTISLTNTVYLVRGDMISVTDYDREFRILEIDTDTNTIVIDESILVRDRVTGGTQITLTGRWAPIEVPIINDRVEFHFDENPYTNQPKLQTTQINDSIFFTNAQDDIMKFDGTNLYRAGLPSWEPVSRSWVDYDEPGITLPNYSYLKAVVADGKLYFDLDNMPQFVGITEIYIGEESNEFAVGFKTIGIIDRTEGFVEVDGILANSDGDSHKTFTIAEEASYYFKLQAFDRNNNIVASAVTHPDDTVVELRRSGKVRHQLTGLPKFDVYDYDRVDLMVYRSRVSTSASGPWFEIRRFPLDFETAKALNNIIITDSTPDVFPIASPGDDQSSISVKGPNLPTQTSMSFRSKYLTTTKNHMVAGNIQGYNTVEVALVSESGISAQTMDDVEVSVTDGTNTIEGKFFNPVASNDFSQIELTSSVQNRSTASSPDTIQFSNGFLQTGDSVYFSLVPGGSYPTGFSPSGRYFVIIIGTGIFRSYQFATTYENALAGINDVTFTGGGENGVLIDSYDIRFPNHGYETGDTIFFQTTGALPAPLSPNTTYYVIKVSDNSIELALSYADALSETPIVIQTSEEFSIFPTTSPYLITSANEIRGVVLPNTGTLGDVVQKYYKFVTSTFTADVGSDELTVTTDDFQTGDRVKVSSTGGVPAPLSVVTAYFIIKTGLNTVKVASSFADAIANIPVDITSTGAGTHTIKTDVYDDGIDLKDKTSYYLIPIDATTYQLAETYEKALAGIPVSFSNPTGFRYTKLGGVGAGIHTLYKKSYTNSVERIAVTTKDTSLTLSIDQIEDYVDIGTGNTQELATGHRVVFSNTDTWTVTGITLGTTYYIIVDPTDSSKVQLASSYTDAVDGTAISITWTSVVGDSFMQVEGFNDYVADHSFFTVSMVEDIGPAPYTDYLSDKWIQLESFLTKDGGDVFRPETSATSISYNNGRYCGWWRVVASADKSVVIEVADTEGWTSWVDSVSDAPVYMAFDLDSDKIPLFAFPSQGNLAVTKVTFQDTKNFIENTNASSRGLRSIRNMFNRVMVEEASPWALARGGSTLGGSAIAFEAVRPSQIITTTFTIPSTSDVQIFVNNLRTPSGTAASGITRVFPSRLLISYKFYPEIFDNPLSLVADYSDSIVDINKDDGQEITGYASFMNQSTTTGATLEAVLVVFKNDSIHVLNIDSQEVSRVESLGQGCTIPGSIASTEEGIVFANKSGIYVVTRELRVVYLGSWMERYWRDNTNFDDVAIEASGLNDARSRKYKLSIPTGSGRTNQETLVYDYIKEEKPQGAWGLYDSIPASVWHANEGATQFGNYKGEVFQFRDTNTATDFRDDTAAIASTFEYAPQSFGDSGTRMNVRRVISHIQGETDATNVQVDMAVDMNTTYEPADTINEALSSGKKLFTIANSPPTEHCNFIQVKWTHATKDEDFHLSGVDFKVSALEELGIEQAGTPD